MDEVEGQRVRAKHTSEYRFCNILVSPPSPSISTVYSTCGLGDEAVVCLLMDTVDEDTITQVDSEVNAYRRVGSEGKGGR